MNFKTPFLLFCFSCLGLGAMAQTAGQTISPLRNIRIAVFAPLYLDSVFNENGFKYSKNFPKFVTPGFDFIQGMQMALDSLDKTGVNVYSKVYDSKSLKNDVGSVISSGALNNIDLIIGSVKDREYFQLAAFAQQKHIPFVSATYPNNGGIKNNPFLIIVNSTLEAHCEAIFSYLVASHGTEKILFVRKPGVRGDFISQYFERINLQDGKPILNLDIVNVENNDFSIMQSRLDSTRSTVVVGASINYDFAKGLTESLAGLQKKYQTMLIGMPNWDGFALHNSKTKDYSFLYTTPFYNSKWQKESKDITSQYRAKYKGMPSDMVYRGYEATSYFVSLLKKYPLDVMNHLNDPISQVFTTPLFRPQFSSEKDMIPDYFENKKLYFIKSMNGAITKAW